MKIAFFDAKPYDRTFFDSANKNHNFEITYFESRLTTETVSLAQGFNAVCAFVNDIITKEIIETLYSFGVKVIALRSAGYNNVDLKGVYKKIHVVRVPEYSPYAVAEHAVALLLTLNRKIHRAFNRTRESNFSIQGLMGFDLHGKVAGVIGTGKIGKQVCRILRGFGMDILAVDLYPDHDFAQEVGLEYTELKRALQESDVLLLQCPLTKESYHLINSETLSLLKDGAVIVNTSRGQLIDTHALVEELKTGRLGGACLDVYEEETDYFFEDFSDTYITDDVLARLLTFNNVLITSHQGFFTKEALTKISQVTLENIQDFVKGEFLKNEICYKCSEPECLKKQKKRCF